MSNKIYTKCFICGKQESLFFKYYKVNGKWLKNPNEFWICDNCFKIKSGEILKDITEEYYFQKSFFF